MTRTELMAGAGVSKSTVDHIQVRYNLHKSPEHIHNMGVKAGKASHEARHGIPPKECYTKEAIAKRVATYKERYRVDDMRVRWGLKQTTRIRLKHKCKRQRDQRWYLIQLGYVIDDANFIAYYTPKTHRAPRLEKIPRGEKKGYARSYYEFRPLTPCESC